MTELEKLKAIMDAAHIVYDDADTALTVAYRAQVNAVSAYEDALATAHLSYEDGLIDGHTEGYDEGFADGKEAGYESGYEAGREDTFLEAKYGRDEY